MSDNDKRLIEDYLPIKAISAEASREKSVRKGHISTLHLWWARRPLVACRAAVFGALVPADWPARNAKLKEQLDSELNGDIAEARKKHSGKVPIRATAAAFVKHLCKYPGSPRAIQTAQRLILEAHAERLTKETGKPVTVEDILAGRAPRPKVLDMFAGGGAIPLEALRLGCEAYALDLNPVAHIIELCTLVYPQKYGKPDPNTRGMTGPKNEKGETTWGGLAEEVRYWGNWVLEKVKAEIGDLYPLIPDPKAKPEEIGAASQTAMEFVQDPQQRLKTPAGYLTPVAYLWTRTVRCKNPSCGATVPLVKQTWLCKKKGRYVALKMIAPKGEKRVRFEVVEATTEKGLGFDPTAFSKGGNATCPFCGTVADSDYVQMLGKEKNVETQLMATVCVKSNAAGKVYVPATQSPVDAIPNETAIRDRIEILSSKCGLDVPKEPINPVRPSPNARGLSAVTRHGQTNFGDLFTSRQVLYLLTLSAVVREVELEVRKFLFDTDRVSAIVAHLGIMVNRQADYNSTVCAWHNTRELIGHTFGRQALPMVWDFSELSPFGEASGSPDGALNWIVSVVEVQANIDQAAAVFRGSATNLQWPEGFFDAVITDPPYYDNVPYADISDFFYVWLKRTVGNVYPEHFATELSPKKLEATALAGRYDGDMSRANAEYEMMMFESFRQAFRVLKPGGQIVVVYAHKTTLGWATLVDALRRAGFMTMEAWPLDTEMSARLVAMETASLASSIFLVARKREGTATGSYEDEVRPELERIVRERVETLWEMGITGADLVIAAVGAGLRAFTRFAKVEYANGEEVPAEKFLAEVEGVVLEILLEKIFGVPRAGVAAVDGASRFYVLWRYTYKAAEMDAGEAIVFPYGQGIELDGQHGLPSQKPVPLVEKKKGKYLLRDSAARGQHEKLGLPNENGGPAPLIDVLHRILWLIENEPRTLPKFLDEAEPNRERLRLIAQALAGAGLKGKSEEEAGMRVTTTSSEQTALNKLLANWQSLVEQPLVVREQTLFYGRKA